MRFFSVADRNLSLAPLLPATTHDMLPFLYRIKRFICFLILMVAIVPSAISITEGEVEDRALIIPKIHHAAWDALVKKYAPSEQKNYLLAFAKINPCSDWGQDCIRTTKMLDELLSNKKILPVEKAIVLDALYKARVAKSRSNSSKYAEEALKICLDLCNRSLAIRIDTLGEYDLSTVVSMEYLADALSESAMQLIAQPDASLGRLNKAIELRKKILGVRLVLFERRPQFIASDPGFLALSESIAKLANAYQRAGRHVESGPLNELFAYINSFTDMAAQINRMMRLKGFDGLASDDPKVLVEIIRAQIQWSLAQVASFQGKLALAIEHGNMAINHFQSACMLAKQFKHVELAIQNGLQVQKSAQVSATQIKIIKKREFDYDTVYKTLAGWLIDTGRVAESQQVMNMLAQQEYNKFKFDSEPAHTTPIFSQLQPLRNKQSDISSQIIQLGSSLAELEDIAATRGLTNEELSRRASLLDAREVARKAYQAAFSEMEKQIARQNPEVQKQVQELNLRLIQPLQATLKRLGKGTVLVHFVMLEQQTKIILTTANAPPIVRHSPVEYVQLKSRIAALRQRMQHPGALSELQNLSQEMYRLLLGPIEDDLKQAQAKTIMLALHGELRYLPFAALHDGSGYLIERYNLASYNEATRDRLRDQPNPSGSFAAFGLTRGVAGFNALPGVKLELDGLLQNGWLKGTASLDNDFSKDALRVALDRKPSMLHIASHFVFRPGREDKSFLLLGTGEKLPISDMHSFQFDGVDLVTLSACETAVGGGKDENGVEIAGLASVVQENGAQAVMATLWQVEDTSTAQLVREFYQQRQQGKSKAESLRLAQINVMRSENASDKQPERGAVPVNAIPASPATKTGNTGWSHPYYWAPFILMGNWL